MNEKNEVDFKGIIDKIKENDKKKTNKLYEEAQKNGLTTSRRSFYNYCKGKTVPDVVTAKLIFDSLNVQYDDNFIINILSNSKGTGSYENDFRLRRTVNIDLKKITDRKISKELIKKILDNRVKQTSKSFDEYIEKLIREDLEKGILERKK